MVCCVWKNTTCDLLESELPEIWDHQMCNICKLQKLLHKLGNSIQTLAMIGKGYWFESITLGSVTLGNQLNWLNVPDVSTVILFFFCWLVEIPFSMFYKLQKNRVWNWWLHKNWNSQGNWFLRNSIGYIEINRSTKTKGSADINFLGGSPCQKSNLLHPERKLKRQPKQKPQKGYGDLMSHWIAGRHQATIFAFLIF